MSQLVIHSFRLEIAIATPSFASLFLRSISQKVDSKLNRHENITAHFGKCFASWFGKSPNKQTETFVPPMVSSEAWVVFENNFLSSDKLYFLSKNHTHAYSSEMQKQDHLSVMQIVQNLDGE